MRPEPQERLVFSQIVDGLLNHGLGGELSAGLRERLREEGLDVSRQLLPAYPVDAWIRCLHHVVNDVFPGVPREEAFRKLGTRTVEGLGKTFAGMAMYGALRLLGARGMVLRLPRDLGGTDNYTNAVLNERGPSDFEMWVNSNPDLPGYSEALFAALLRVSGARDPEVTKSKQTAGDAVYRMRWR